MKPMSPTPATPTAGSDPAMGDTGPKEVRTYCIEEYADGTFKVGIEAPEAPETPEDPAAPDDQAEGDDDQTEGDDDQGYQPAKSLDDALKMVKQLSMSQDTSKNDMQAGFSQAFGEPGQSSPFQKAGY